MFILIVSMAYLVFPSSFYIYETPQEGVRIYVIVHNRYTPVITMDPARLWPMAAILSYPMKIPGTPPFYVITNMHTHTHRCSESNGDDHR